MLRLGPVDSWDPQRLYVAADMAFAGRVFERTLTGLGTGDSGGHLAEART